MRPDSRIPVHPGEVLREEFLLQLGKSAEELSAHIGATAEEIGAVLREEQPVSPRLAWLLSMALDTTPEFWLNLQQNHDLARHRPQTTVGKWAS